jgi:chromosome segregation protein
MSGGFFKPIGGFGEYDESKKMLEGINREVLRLEAKRNRLRGMEEDLKEKLKELNKKVLDLEREKGVSGDRISSLEKQVDDLVKIIAEMELRYKEERSSLKEARQLHRRAIARSKAARGELKELMAEKRAIEEQLESMGDEGLLSEVRVIEEKILELEKEKEAKLARIELNDSRIRDILRPKFDSLKDRIVELFNARKSIRREISRSTQEMKEVESRVEVQEKRVEEVAKGLEELRGRRDSLLKAVSAIERKRDDLKERHLRVRRTIEDSRVEIARLEAKLEDVLEALEEYADLNIELIAPMDTDELEREISRMEAEMRSLEPINMRAVEDYENVKEKYDALTNKINKLLEEKEAILRLMDEIERRKLNIFMEAFENIALNFRRIFEELSNGGEADMILDEENPLEGGLQIQARPVGKNLQHIELMSGGEKTLTAISFIFAIQRYQPAPFYILDEVDMFLDDENLRRVSELVKESSRGAQFIVVSLRDSLMASADQLFGVVNEDGISKIIGVELQEIGSSSG